MHIVDKITADSVIAGIYPVEGWKEIVHILKYTNVAGNESYTLYSKDDRPATPILSSPYMINPEIYWEKK